MGVAPRFSIVMPVYNVGAYLDESVGSVLAQTCPDYEVVMVDDGSTDGSGEKCDAYAAEHPNFRVIHQENRGLLMARRVGLRHVTGDYVVTLDSDDMLRADALALVSDAVDRWAPDVVTFEHSRSPSFKSYGPAALGTVAGFYDGGRYDELKRVVCRGFHNNLWSKVFRRSIVDVDADYSAHQGMTHAEDLLQILPAIDQGESFAYLAEPLYFYRPNPSSATKSYKPRQLDDLGVALKALLGYAGKWGDGCLGLAHRSALLQCGYLLHMLMGDRSMEEGARRREFERLCSYAESAGLFGSWQGDLRADKRLEAEAMEAHDYVRARRLVRLFEAMKRVRDAVASRGR